MGNYGITGWSAGSRQSLTYNLKAGQFRGMGRVRVPNQTTIINNNVFTGGYGVYDNHNCGDTTPKWMNWMMGLGFAGTILGGILNLFGIGGGSTPPVDDGSDKKTTETTEYGDPYYTLENSVVINYLKKYFGNDVVVIGEKLRNPSFAYNNGMEIVDYVDGKYIVRFSGIGGGVGGPLPKITERKIISATIENNEIVVKEKAIYWGITSEQETITFDVYSDVKKKNKIDSKEYTEDNIANEIVTVEDYLDEASTITTKFAYDQDTNSYYFKSSVIE